MKTHKKILFYALLITFSDCMFAQVTLKGVVLDVATNATISGANVTLVEDNINTVSDNNGYFEFFIESLDSNVISNELIGKLYSQASILLWQFNTPFKLLIITQSGERILFLPSALSNGSHNLSSLADGIYFAHLNSGNDIRNYSLLKTNNQLKIYERKGLANTFDNNPLFYKTMTVNRTDYCDRTMEVSALENNFSIELLKISYDDLNFFNKLISKQAFDMICDVPAKTHLGNVESIKFIYDRDLDKVFYINSKKYHSHSTFAMEHMNYTKSRRTFTLEQYTNNSNRYLFPGTLNYFKNLNLFTFEFFSGDGATCEDVDRIYKAILESSYLSDELYFYSTNQSWDKCTIKTIDANELYEGQNYQALNQEKSYGYLRKIEKDSLNLIYLNKHDVVVLNDVPNDISIVSGIITTKFQTPLSHINVLSHNRGTPNMALSDAFENKTIDKLLGKLVYLEVLSDTFIIREASFDEASEFWIQTEPQDTINLNYNITMSGIVDLDETTIQDIDKIGGKAANFSEIVNAFENNNSNPCVPEGYFALPFYYYNEHIKNFSLDIFINEMLNDEQFKTDYYYRNNKLKQLRDSIINSPINIDFLSMVIQKNQKESLFDGFRFRSSTNAEDIEGFNGAGLYNSYTGKVSEGSESVERAIKKVWASLWNLSAFEEREYFKIDHRTCFMGILVHRSFPNEDANGVVITTDLYNNNSAYTINAQIGEYSVVNPQPGVLYDQIILYHTSFSNLASCTIEYIGFTNLNLAGQNHVLTDSELFQLTSEIMIIQKHFYENVYPGDCFLDKFALDIEFKFDSHVSDRKLYIKQARLY